MALCFFVGHEEHGIAQVCLIVLLEDVLAGIAVLRDVYLFGKRQSFVCIRPHEAHILVVDSNVVRQSHCRYHACVMLHTLYSPMCLKYIVFDAQRNQLVWERCRLIIRPINLHSDRPTGCGASSKNSSVYTKTTGSWPLFTWATSANQIRGGIFVPKGVYIDGHVVRRGFGQVPGGLV